MGDLFNYCKERQWTQLENDWLENSMFELTDDEIKGYYSLTHIDNPINEKKPGILINKLDSIENQLILFKAFIDAYSEDM